MERTAISTRESSTLEICLSYLIQPVLSASLTSSLQMAVTSVMEVIVSEMENEAENSRGARIVLGDCLHRAVVLNRGDMITESLN